MSIRPIDFNGMVQNTTEVSVTKTQEDQRPMTEQQNVAVTIQQEVEASTHQVQSRDQAADQAFDFSGEGDGTGYEGNRGKKRRKKDEKAPQGDGSVHIKSEHPSFDLKI